MITATGTSHKPCWLPGRQKATENFEMMNTLPIETTTFSDEILFGGDIPMKWHPACQVDDVPMEGGVCVLIEGMQIAVFRFARKGQWYASQNECPHRQQMALSRGMTGSHNGEPKVACPFHKRTFSLRTGECLNAGDCSIQVYPVRVDREQVFIGIPK